MKSLIDTSEKQRLISNFFSLAILQGANYLLPLITFPYLVRVLGVEKFGLLAFATATIAYFSVIVDYGFNLTATKDVSINRDNIDKLNEIFSSVMVIKFILLLISFIILVFLTSTFNKFGEYSTIFYLTFGMLIGQVLFPQWLFQGMERMKYITILNVLAKFIFLVAIFIFIHNESDYWKVPLINSLGFIVSGVLSIYVVKRDFNIEFKFQRLNTLKIYFIDGWYLFLSSFFGNFYRNFNTLVLGFLTNNLFVGYYSIAEKIVRILQSLQVVVGNTLFPYFSKKISKDKSYFFKFDREHKRYMYAIYSIGAVLLFILSPYIVYILNGNFEENITLNLKILSVVFFIGGLNYFYGVLGLVTMNYQKEFSIAIIYTGIINIFLSFILVYLFNDMGASLSLVFSELFLLLFILNSIRRIKR